MKTTKDTEFDHIVDFENLQVIVESYHRMPHHIYRMSRLLKFIEEHCDQNEKLVILPIWEETMGHMVGLRLQGKE